VAEASLSSLTCSACGNCFSLIDEAADELPLSGAFGHFEILRHLGSGGFGAVYQAHDAQLDRVVALKIPRRGQLTAAEADQFLREARTAAQLRHPHIVSVHEVGRHAETFYIVSDFIDGESLAARLARQPLAAREAAAMCQKLAQALHHAHEAGIVHRDLKPANVLLDQACEPHITDFGLARRETGEVTLTMDGVVVGTPAYMSPEQARGQSHHADRRSDLYSLGVILFELLTGELPFRGNMHMVTEQILTEEPPGPRKLNATVPRDLETITLKCLEKDPARRYATAQALADDLGRYLHGEPILARPVGRVERTWRWCKRKPAQAALVAVLVLVGVAAPVVALQQHASRQAAQVQAQTARWQQYLSDMHAATKAWDDSDVGRVLEILERNRPAPGQPDLRRFEWYYLWRQCQPSLAVPTFQHADGVWALALTSDGSKLVVGLRGSLADVIQVWDVARRAKLQSLSGPNWPQAIAISPDDRLMATGGVEDIVRLWDLATGSQLHELVGHANFTWGVAISPDGGLVASGSPDRTVKLWDAKTGELLHTFTDERAKFTHALAFAPDGQALAAGTEDGSVKLWNVPSRTLARTLVGHTGTVASLVFSRDGQILVTGGADRIVRLWNPADGTLRSAFVGHTNSISAVAISPDGSAVASAGNRDGTVRVWDMATGAERLVLRGHKGSVKALRYSTNGALFSGGSDGAVKVWNLNHKYDVNVLRGDTYQTWSLVIAKDGKTVAAGGGDGTVRLWDLETGQLLKSHTVTVGDGVDALALSPDGQKLACGHHSGRIELWNLATDEVIRLRDSGGEITALAWSADGRVLVSGDAGDDNNVILWNPTAAQQRMRLPGHQGRICSAAFSPDDQTLAIRCEDDTLRIWDPSTGTLLKTIDGLSGYFFSPLAFSADGTLLACADLDHVIQIRETTGWEVVRTAAGHTDHIKGLAFSPDGRTLASACDDGQIKLWEVATGEERSTLRGHFGEVEAVRFTPDGQTLVSSGQDGTVRLWRASSPADVNTPRGR
jgi:WD40 repeat protein